MKNYGYLISLFMSRKISSLVRGGRGSLNNPIYINFIRVVMIFCGILVFGYVLIKYYEVPVYYTKIDAVYKNCEPQLGGNLNIKLCRNYDRKDKSIIIPNSSAKYSRENISESGLFICASFKKKESTINDSINRIERLTTESDSIMNIYRGEIMKNPQMVYISAQTSLRQSLIYTNKPHRVYVDSITNEELESNFLFNIFNSADVIGINPKYRINDYFCFLYFDWSDNGVVANDFTIVSEKDEEFPVFFSFYNNSFLRPSIWKTAEDVSKLVEVIELGHSKREHDKYAGAWSFTNSLTIDYVGPSEFSENICPEPDEKGLTYIRYTDKNKIEQIGRHGLRYHVRFPDMENIQETRIFILSGILTGLGAFFVRYLWRLFYSFIIYTNEKNNKQSKSKLGKWNNLFLVVISIALLIGAIFCLYLSFKASNVEPFILGNRLMS